ncbi:hypothetical protein NQ071_27055, partial [Escherichia coli]|nr:hypothetical protein [Escherichia coli]MDF7606463.1 hypothetical protein [Escherichia coli]MDF7621676.1 hypothetical protein [Escherichia coli]
AQYTQHELDLVAAQLNNRPRKTLKFKTPKEIIERGVEPPRVSWRVFYL